MRQYHINRMFQHDQKKVYQQLQGNSQMESQSSNADESTKSLSDIWDNKKEHNKRADWLEELRNSKLSVLQNDTEIAFRMVKQQKKKIPNWKAPGPHRVQGFWIKKLTSLYERIEFQLNDFITNGKEIPLWTTTGKTALCQKDPAKGNAVDIYRRISCLLLMWKFMTEIISETVYMLLDENEMLPEEQKGLKKK